MIKSKKTITVLQLYPNEMNIYGDRGNVLTVMRRLQWHGYTPALAYHHPGKPLPKDVDIILGGGGQDSGQEKVQDDLLRIGSSLHKLADQDTPMLMVCGLYQLFGRFFRTHDGSEIKGISMFDMETLAGPTRLIGNTVLSTPYGQVVGYENHSGQTLLDDGQEAFGTIVKGEGNNTKDKTEGAIYKSVIGTYLHGSLLPKNPDLADALIEKAVIRRYGEFEGNVIDDAFARTAHQIASKRPR